MTVMRPFATYMDDELARLGTDDLLALRKRVTAYLLANEDDDAAAYLGRVKAVAVERLAAQARRDAEPRQDAAVKPDTRASDSERPVQLAQVPDRFPRDRRLPSKAFAMPLTLAEFKVFAVINARANDDGVCNPGCKRLADDAGVNVKTVVAALPRLRDLGMILYRRGDFKETNVYTVRDVRKWKRTGRLPVNLRGAAKPKILGRTRAVNPVGGSKAKS